MILLTGATGFIGQHLLGILSEKYGKENIVILSSVPIEGYKFIYHNNYQFDRDIWLKNGVAEIETVIHAGAFIPKEGSDANNITACNSNIINTAALLTSCSAIRQFVFLSTIDIYDTTGGKIDETSRINPVSLYGHSKYYCEKMVEAWGLEMGKLIQILRIGHIYGPGEGAYKKIIPMAMNNLLSGKAPQIYSAGNEKRSFLFVKDCCNYIIKSLSLETYTGPINIVAGESITVKELVYKIAGIAGTGIEPEILNKNIPTRDYLFNAGKLNELLESAETSLDTGLQEEWHYFMGRVTS